MESEEGKKWLKSTGKKAVVVIERAMRVALDRYKRLGRRLRKAIAAENKRMSLVCDKGRRRARLMKKRAYWKAKVRCNSLLQHAAEDGRRDGVVASGFRRLNVRLDVLWWVWCLSYQADATEEDELDMRFDFMNKRKDVGYGVVVFVGSS